MYQPRYEETTRLKSFLKEIDKINREEIQKLPPDRKKKLQKTNLYNSLSFALRLKGKKPTPQLLQKIITNQVTNLSSETEIFATNYFEGLKWVTNTPKKPSFNLLTTIHQIISKDLIYSPNSIHLRSTNLSLISSFDFHFNPPSYLRLPVLLEEFFSFLNSKDIPHPLVTAAISYFLLLILQPFDQFSEETSRLFSLFYISNFYPSIRGFFSLERVIFNSQPEYYSHLKKILQESKEPAEYELTSWIEFFLQMIIKELLLTLVPSTLATPGPMTQTSAKHISQHPHTPQSTTSPSTISNLPPRQIVLLNYLKENQTLVMAQARQLFPQVSDDTLLRELQALQKLGLIKKEGKTKGTYYTLA